MSRPFLIALAALLPWMVLADSARAQISLDLGIDLGSSGGAVSVGGSTEAVTGGAAASDPGSAPATGRSEPPAPEIVPLGPDGALAAVKSGRAVPLEMIMTAARLDGGVEVIDAQLISVRGTLVYELKVIDQDGDVSERYFYARSGERVKTN
jgi:hypothetical protein